MNGPDQTQLQPSISARLTAAFSAAAAAPVLILIVWLALAERRLDLGTTWPGLALALAATVLAVLNGRAVVARLDHDLWQLLRIARRLASGDYSYVAPVVSNAEARGLQAELESIGVRLEALQGALDHLEVTSGFELGRRNNEVEAWRSETQRLQSEASVLHSFATAVNRTVDPAQICSQFVSHAEGSVDFVWAVAYLVDPSTKRLVPAVIWDRKKDLRLVGRHLRQVAEAASLGERPEAATAVRERRVLRIGEGQDDPWRSALPSGLRSMVVVPLVAKSEELGAVQFADSRGDAYGENEEQFLATLGGQAAIAIANARLLEEAAKVEALRELDRLKSELLSTVSHELRTPLVSIKGYAETLLRPDVTWSEEERREFLQYIDEESDRLRSLIDDLLQMSQIEAGKLRITRQSVPLGRLAQRVARKARLQAPEHSISISFPGDVPRADADPKRIEQVLTNLIHNAVKYSPQGGAIRVRGFAATARSDGRYDYPGSRRDFVVVTVADEGVGIPPEHQRRIFDRFYRVDGKLARETGGSGLGLAICKGIVDAHGGRIWVESPSAHFRAGEASRGSTFFFSLPARSADPDAEDLDLEPIESSEDPAEVTTA